MSSRVSAKASGQVSGQIDRLQALRFVAAFMVLIRHVLMEIEGHGQTVAFGAELMRVPWGAGVDLFFVISGFIMALIAWDKPAGVMAASDFVARRLIRIWPTYLIFSVLAVAAIVIVPAGLENQKIDVAHVIASLTFIPWPRPDDGQLYPVLGQGWTLNYEMFFYAVLAIFLVAPRAIRFIGVTVVLVVLVIVAAASPLPYFAEFYGNSIVLEFVLGIGLCWLYRRGVSVPGVMAGLAVLVSMAALFVMESYPELPRIVSRGLPCSVIVSAVILWRRGEAALGVKPLPDLGDASYALYLSHPFVVNALLIVWLKLNGSMETFAAVAIAASVVFSLLFFRFVEKPLRGGMLRLYDRPGRARAAAAARRDAA
ncbi:MAG: acyltransferase [Hyphomonadaceae bacterium]